MIKSSFCIIPVYHIIKFLENQRNYNEYSSDNIPKYQNYFDNKNMNFPDHSNNIKKIDNNKKVYHDNLANPNIESATISYRELRDSKLGLKLKNRSRKFNENNNNKSSNNEKDQFVYINKSITKQNLILDRSADKITKQSPAAAGDNCKINNIQFEEKQYLNPESRQSKLNNILDSERLDINYNNNHYNTRLGDIQGNHSSRDKTEKKIIINNNNKTKTNYVNLEGYENASKSYNSKRFEHLESKELPEKVSQKHLKNSKRNDCSCEASEKVANHSFQEDLNKDDSNSIKAKSNNHNSFEDVEKKDISKFNSSKEKNSNSKILQTNKHDSYSMRLKSKPSSSSSSSKSSESSSSSKSKSSKRERKIEKESSSSSSSSKSKKSSESKNSKTRNIIKNQNISHSELVQNISNLNNKIEDLVDDEIDEALENEKNKAYMNHYHQNKNEKETLHNQNQSNKNLKAFDGIEDKINQDFGSDKQKVELTYINSVEPKVNTFVVINDTNSLKHSNNVLHINKQELLNEKEKAENLKFTEQSAARLNVSIVFPNDKQEILSKEKLNTEKAGVEYIWNNDPHNNQLRLAKQDAKEKSNYDSFLKNESVICGKSQKSSIKDKSKSNSLKSRNIQAFEGKDQNISEDSYSVNEFEKSEKNGNLSQMSGRAISIVHSSNKQVIVNKNNFEDESLTNIDIANDNTSKNINKSKSIHNSSLNIKYNNNLNSKNFINEKDRFLSEENTEVDKNNNINNLFKKEFNQQITPSNLISCANTNNQDEKLSNRESSVAAKYDHNKYIQKSNLIEDVNNINNNKLKNLENSNKDNLDNSNTQSFRKDIVNLNQNNRLKTSVVDKEILSQSQSEGLLADQGIAKAKLGSKNNILNALNVNKFELSRTISNNNNNNNHSISENAKAQTSKEHIISQADENFINNSQADNICRTANANINSNSNSKNNIIQNSFASKKANLKSYKFETDNLSKLIEAENPVFNINEKNAFEFDNKSLPDSDKSLLDIDKGSNINDFNNIYNNKISKNKSVENNNTSKVENRIISKLLVNIKSDDTSYMKRNNFSENKKARDDDVIAHMLKPEKPSEIKYSEYAEESRNLLNKQKINKQASSLNETSQIEKALNEEDNFSENLLKQSMEASRISQIVNSILSRNIHSELKNYEMDDFPTNNNIHYKNSNLSMDNSQVTKSFKQGQICKKSFNESPTQKDGSMFINNYKDSDGNIINTKLAATLKGILPSSTGQNRSHLTREFIDAEINKQAYLKADACKA